MNREPSPPLAAHRAAETVVRGVRGDRRIESEPAHAALDDMAACADELEQSADRLADMLSDAEAAR